MPLAIEDLRKTKITGEKIRLVPFSSTHLYDHNYLRWLQDYEIVKFINRPEYLHKISFEEVKAYVEDKMASQGDLFFAIETSLEHKFIGTVRIADINWHSKNVNLGILIGDKSYWGKGIATEAFSLAIDFSFNQLEMHKIFGGCMEPNIGMRKIFEKNGFEQEGCLKEQDFLEGKYYNHIFYGLLKDKYYLIKADQSKKKIIN